MVGRSVYWPCAPSVTLLLLLTLVLITVATKIAPGLLRLNR